MSQPPTRAIKAEELAKTLSTIANAEELDEWGIRRLEREAQVLMNADPVAAHTVLGGIASLRGDVAKVDKHHKIALQLSGNSVETLRNSAASLSRIGKMNEAFEAILQAHDRVPDDPPTLHAAISMAVQSAHFQKGRDLYRRWNKLCPDGPMAEETDMNKAAEAVDNGMFSEEGAQKVVLLAHQVRRAAGVRTAGGGVLALYGESESFLFDIKVRAASEQAAELSEEFANQIVADDELMTDPGLKFTLIFIGTRTNGSDIEATP